MKTRVLFVCHGNICRSPMAEFVLKDMVEKRGMKDMFDIASAATSREEIWNCIGNPVYPPVLKLLSSLGIDASNKRARQVTREDYDKYDYIICMDHNNMSNISYIIQDDPKHKISMLLNRDVADPWYTRDFNKTYQDILLGCNMLLEKIMRDKA